MKKVLEIPIELDSMNIGINYPTIEFPIQLVKAAIETPLSGNISGIYNQTTGPKDNEKNIQ